MTATEPNTSSARSLSAQGYWVLAWGLLSVLGCPGGSRDAGTADGGRLACIDEEIRDALGGLCGSVPAGSPDAPICAECLDAATAGCALAEDCLVAVDAYGSILAGNEMLLGTECCVDQRCIVLPSAPVRCDAGVCRFAAEAFACKGSGTGMNSGCELVLTSCDCVAVAPGTALSSHGEPKCVTNTCPAAPGEVACVDEFCELDPSLGRELLRVGFCAALAGGV